MGFDCWCRAMEKALEVWLRWPCVKNHDSNKRERLSRFGLIMQICVLREILNFDVWTAKFKETEKGEKKISLRNQVFLGSWQCCLIQLFSGHQWIWITLSQQNFRMKQLAKIKGNSILFYAWFFFSFKLKENSSLLCFDQQWRNNFVLSLQKSRPFNV